VMLRTCDRCGKPYEARRRDSRWCGSTCRDAQSKRPIAPVAQIATHAIQAKSDSMSDPSAKSPMAVAVEAELSAAGRLNTAKGWMVMAAVERLSNSGLDTASGFAAVLREARACLDDALASGAVADDPLEELRARRAKRLQP
jgi:hypothetical protein